MESETFGLQALTTESVSKLGLVALSGAASTYLVEDWGSKAGHNSEEKNKFSGPAATSTFYG